MLALFKKKKSKPPKPCIHQQNSSANAEASPKPSLLRQTGDLKAVQNDTKETLPEAVNVEKHHDQTSNEAPEPKEIQCSGPCSVCKQEKRAARRYRWLLTAGLFFPFTVQALDATIIAGALPFIASDFRKCPVLNCIHCHKWHKRRDYSHTSIDELAQLNWIVSAFNLTSATFIPAWGQFADIFGRHAALQTALVLMLLGSSLCAGAPTNAYPMLLVGRALQGISCAGLNILTHVILSDKVSLKENAMNNTIFALVGGVGWVAGPVTGGYLTEVTWRWCFIINLPIAIIGMIFTFFLLRPRLLGPQIIPGVDDAAEMHGLVSFKIKLSTIDYGGQILFLFGMGLLVLALTWGGSYYPWSDVKVLAPLVIGFVLFSAFISWEFLMTPGQKLAIKFPRQMPMVPFKLLWSRNAGLLIYINFITGMGTSSRPALGAIYKLTRPL
jgi:MFS family permease